MEPQATMIVKVCRGIRHHPYGTVNYIYGHGKSKDLDPDLPECEKVACVIGNLPTGQHINKPKQDADMLNAFVADGRLEQRCHHIVCSFTAESYGGCQETQVAKMQEVMYRLAGYMHTRTTDFGKDDRDDNGAILNKSYDNRIPWVAGIHKNTRKTHGHMALQNFDALTGRSIRITEFELGYLGSLDWLQDYMPEVRPGMDIKSISTGAIKHPRAAPLKVIVEKIRPKKGEVMEPAKKLAELNLKPRETKSGHAGFVVRDPKRKAPCNITLAGINWELRAVIRAERAVLETTLKGTIDLKEKEKVQAELDRLQPVKIVSDPKTKELSQVPTSYDEIEAAPQRTRLDLRMGYLDMTLEQYDKVCDVPKRDAYDAQRRMIGTELKRKRKGAISPHPKSPGMSHWLYNKPHTVAEMGDSVPVAQFWLDVARDIDRWNHVLGKKASAKNKEAYERALLKAEWCKFVNDLFDPAKKIVDNSNSDRALNHLLDDGTNDIHVDHGLKVFVNALQGEKVPQGPKQPKLPRYLMTEDEKKAYDMVGERPKVTQFELDERQAAYEDEMRKGKPPGGDGNPPI